MSGDVRGCSDVAFTGRRTGMSSGKGQRVQRECGAGAPVFISPPSAHPSEARFSGWLAREEEVSECSDLQFKGAFCRVVDATRHAAAARQSDADPLFSMLSPPRLNPPHTLFFKTATAFSFCFSLPHLGCIHHRCPYRLHPPQIPLHFNSCPFFLLLPKSPPRFVA